jgi:hypothetical protein
LTLVVVLAVGAGPAWGRGTTTWFTYTHGHLNQTVSGGISGGYLRTFGWSIRSDYPSWLSLTLNLEGTLLWNGPPSMGVLAPRFLGALAHYRVDAPRLRASAFLGYGAVHTESSHAVTQSWSLGPLLGFDVQYELRNRWLLIGSVAWGPSWRTTLGGLTGPTAPSTYLDYRLAVALPLPRHPGTYVQLGYRGVSLTGIPGTVLCVTTPCSVAWSGFDLGLVIVSRQLPPRTTPPPAVGPGAGIWYTYNHTHLAQSVNGVPTGRAVRTYGWTVRKDFPSAFSLTVDFTPGFLWDEDSGPALGAPVTTTFASVIGHYRFERPRLRASVFAGYGVVRIDTAMTPNELRAQGLLIGIEAQYEFQNRLMRRWVLSGSAAWGPWWRTTVPGAAATGTYLDYRVGLAVPIPRTPNAYFEVAWRAISLSQVPGSILCPSPPCTITWAGRGEIGLVFATRP